MNKKEIKEMLLENPADALKDEDKNEFINKISNIFHELVTKDKKKESKKSKTPIVDMVTPTYLIKRQYDDKMKQTLMDNMHNYLLSRASMQADNTSGEMIGNVILDLAEKLIDKIPAKHFVAVQPMQGPVGLIYCLQYKYNEREKSESGEIEDILSTNTGERKMMLEVNSQAVEAKSRKFENISWTIEAIEDVSATNTSDIDKFAETVLDELATDMAHNVYHEIKTNLLKTAFKETHTLDLDPTLARTQIAIMINKAANEIARKTRRGCGNFIIASKEICNIIQFNEDDNNFTKATNEEYNESDYGFVNLMGTLNGTIKVFCDNEMDADKVLVGYKGKSGETDAGFFYCPYVPVMSTGIVINPLTFQPLINFMTRYGNVEILETAFDITENEDGSSKETVNKSSSSYYAELTINNAKEINEILTKMEGESPDTDNVDIEENDFETFDDALKLLD